MHVPAAASAPRSAAGIACHFGELLQGRLGKSGPVVLVSLPCPVLHVRPGSGDCPVPREVLARFERALGVALPATGLHCDAAPGLGAGSSTAALVALARMAGWQGDALALARACVAAEGASDPLMFDRPERVLWASRLGQVIAPLPRLPRFTVLGGFWGPAHRTDPTDARFPDIADLVDRWRGAPDLATLARLCSASAARCLALRGPADDPTATLAADLGALGWQIAHTGAARGLIFAPGTVPAHATQALRTAGFRDILQFDAGGDA